MDLVSRFFELRSSLLREVFSRLCQVSLIPTTSSSVECFALSPLLGVGLVVVVIVGPITLVLVVFLEVVARAKARAMIMVLQSVFT